MKQGSLTARAPVSDKRNPTLTNTLEWGRGGWGVMGMQILTVIGVHEYHFTGALDWVCTVHPFDIQYVVYMMAK